jgi:hypothetical protein
MIAAFAFFFVPVWQGKPELFSANIAVLISLLPLFKLLKLKKLSYCFFGPPKSECFDMETPTPDRPPPQTKLIHNPIAGTTGETLLQLIDDIRELQNCNFFLYWAIPIFSRGTLAQ